MKKTFCVILLAVLLLSILPMTAMAYEKHTFTYNSDGSLPALKARDPVYAGDEFDFRAITTPKSVMISTNFNEHFYPEVGQTSLRIEKNYLVNSNVPKALELIEAYDIAFELNGGSGSFFKSRLFDFDETVYKIWNKEIQPEKKGYIFDGWFLDAALKRSFDSVLRLSRSKPNTLYAKWIPDKAPKTGDTLGGYIPLLCVFTTASIVTVCVLLRRKRG